MGEFLGMIVSDWVDKVEKTKYYHKKLQTNKILPLEVTNKQNITIRSCKPFANGLQCAFFLSVAIKQVKFIKISLDSSSNQKIKFTPIFKMMLKSPDGMSHVEMAEVILMKSLNSVSWLKVRQIHAFRKLQQRYT